MQYKWVALFVTSLGLLVTGINSRLVLVGLPTVGRELGASVAQLAWVTQGYVLTTTVFALAFGRAGDLFGHVRTYTIGFAIFTVGSALSAISPTPDTLIFFRAVTGTGGAILFTNSVAILIHSSPQRDLGMMIGTSQIALNVGIMLGLTLSGLLLTIADWRALFYVNVPLGLFGTLCSHSMLKEPDVIKGASRRMDWAGLASFTFGFTLLLLGITFAGYGPDETPTALLFSAAGLGVLLAFVAIERDSSAPLLDLALFSVKQFTAENVVSLLVSVSWFGPILVFVFYLQLGLGQSAWQAGLSLLPMQVAFMIASPVSGRLSGRYPKKLFVMLGILLSITGLLTFSFSGLAHGSNIVLAFTLLGASQGMFSPPNISMIVQSAPVEKRGMASGAWSTLFNVGNVASYGVAVVLMTLGIPYSLLNALVVGSPTAGVDSVSLFLNGVKAAGISFALIDVIALAVEFVY